MQSIGIGELSASLVVCIANRPPLEQFKYLDSIRPVIRGELLQVGKLTGNHWKKIFNCFAKLAFELDPQGEISWQQLRDKQLLTDSGSQLLLFSRPVFFDDPEKVIIISGKTYFSQLELGISVDWIDSYFAINREKRLIVSPYFDYRQLSNSRIQQLVSLINSLKH